MDEKIPEESLLFVEFTEYLIRKGVNIQIIENKFDAESLSNFQTIIKNLK
jgi:ABC-type branched-subunit amino acid transport system substrate-binding protein